MTNTPARSLLAPLGTTVLATLFAALSWASVGCDAENARALGGSGGGNDISTGGANPGGANTGGANTGSGSGGLNMGGANPASGTGGAGTGGANAGGANAGGANTGGANTGGANTGGSGTGGISANRACGASDVRDSFSFQVEVPAGTPALGVASFAAYDKDVNGPVTSVKRANNIVRIEVTEAGKAWTLVVSPTGAVDAFEAAATPLVNTNVKLHIRLKRNFQITPSWGFVMRNANDELLMAVDAGPFVGTLASADIAPLELKNGSAVCDDVLCGNVLWAYTQLQVSASGGASAVVGIGANGELTSGNRRYTVRNVGAGHFATGSGIICADIEHSSTWAIWSSTAAQ